jgi:hypothetical protein
MLSRIRLSARLLTCTVALAACLGACKPAPGQWAENSNSQHGRYVGVGLYNPTKQWTHMVHGQAPRDDTLAKPIDDQVIIVVADSATGELRACGDLTGYCIGMNPWEHALGASQIAPIQLTAHAPPYPEDNETSGEVSR